MSTNRTESLRCAHPGTVSLPYLTQGKALPHSHHELPTRPTVNSFNETELTVGIVVLYIHLKLPCTAQK